MTEEHINEVEQEWDFFWKEIVTNDDGSINVEQVKKEFYDFSTLIENISCIYDYVTGGLISRPLTPWKAVAQEYDHHVTKLVEEETEKLKAENERLKEALMKIASTSSKYEVEKDDENSNNYWEWEDNALDLLNEIDKIVEQALNEVTK